MYVTLQETKKMPRKLRKPTHSWHLRYRPFVIQPYAIMPVLPGETLKNAVWQTRTITDPIKNPLIGWWNEHWLFYVKLTDLYDRDKLVQMLMNPVEDMTTLDSATNLDNYHENTSSGSDIDWVKLCLARVVDEYFRYEGETSTTAGTTVTSVAANTVPVAQLGAGGFIDSSINDADYRTNDIELLDISAGTTIEGSDDKLHASEVVNQLHKWELARAAGLTQMSYEEYCATYWGGTAVEEKQHVPELVDYRRQWTYPTNTIDPTNGAPRSACSWAQRYKTTKQRFFKEPGFLFGVTTTRPKVYLDGLSSNAVMLMKSAKTWLPPSLMQDPHAAMTKVAAGDAPLTLNTDAYWVDVRDILLHGDQFLNFALTATDANLFTAPVAGGTNVGQRYPNSTDMDALFVSASPANQCREDGIMVPSIATRFWEDLSPNMIGVDKTV